MLFVFFIYVFYLSHTVDRPLYLSGDIPVFSNVNSSQHVVYFNFGNLTASEFDGITPHPEVTVHIPFLASYPGFGPPSYSLAVAKFYQRSDDENDDEIPRVNIAYPYYPADKISISEKEALIQIGEEELRISFRKSDPCEKPEVVVKHQYDEFRLGELRTGAELPDFSYCGEHHGHNSRFCAVGNDLGDDLGEWKYRICQRWASRDHTSCIASLKIEKMTPMFRDLLSVGVSELRIVSSEQYHGNYTVEMFYPC